MVQVEAAFCCAFDHSLGENSTYEAIQSPETNSNGGQPAAAVEVSASCQHVHPVFSNYSIPHYNFGLHSIEMKPEDMNADFRLQSDQFWHPPRTA